MVYAFKTPDLIRFFKNVRVNNHFVKRWFEDIHFRTKISLYASLLWNTAYGLFLLGTGFYHSSYWFGSLSMYYVTLAVMRFFLLNHTRKYKPSEHIEAELIRYRGCGIVMLVLNLFLSLIIFFMVYWNRTFNHSEITAIAMATYTFTSLSLAISNIIKHRKNASPVFLASKNIALAASCVSMLTLESTMLTTFGSHMDILTRKLMLGFSGLVISIFVISLSLFMIRKGNRELIRFRKEKENE
jgi:hypothetical protein